MAPAGRGVAGWSRSGVPPSFHDAAPLATALDPPAGTPLEGPGEGEDGDLDLYGRVFEAIDMRSFSNLWYWIGLAVFWSSISYYVLGVPWDMVQRARREDGTSAAQDVQDLVRVNVNRLLLIGRVSGLLALWFAAFALTLLTVLAFWYGIEFAQALFFIAVPGAGVAALSVARAHRIAEEQAVGDALYRHLLHHRRTVQVIGMVSIFVTAMFGMYQNLALGVWG